ncbi:Rhodanese-like protein [Sphingobacterium deserti]|uniref:Rhodanese-like protein n=2 Tax=Sphingobacterium deserti TaxID=1229276 RepID=A0A0B8T3X8_9SPHI|nr:Rhodanese-like protein [Sphingobacterium deserti]
MLLLAVSLQGAGTVFAQQSLSPTAFTDSITSSIPLVLDVRTPKEFEQGTLPRAQNFNWKNSEEFKQSAEKLDRSRPIYIFCQSGIRSARAARYLREQGFEVFELDGGLQQLTKEKEHTKHTTD